MSAVTHSVPKNCWKALLAGQKWSAFTHYCIKILVYYCWLVRRCLLSPIICPTLIFFFILVFDLTGSIVVESFKLYYDNWHLVISVSFATARVISFFVCYIFFVLLIFSVVFICTCITCILYLLCTCQVGPLARWIRHPLFGGSWICGLYFSCYPPFLVDKQFPLIVVFHRCDYNKGFKTLFEDDPLSVVF